MKNVMLVTEKWRKVYGDDTLIERQCFDFDVKLRKANER